MTLIGENGTGTYYFTKRQKVIREYGQNNRLLTYRSISAENNQVQTTLTPESLRSFFL